MRTILLLLLSLISLSAFAIPCDCKVMVYAPLTGSYTFPPNELKQYELEDYSSYSMKGQRECRQSCVKAFQDDMSMDRLTALLLTYSERMIEQGVLGYNCTGLTTLKYPVRVKASLGDLGLGNVADFNHIINHEQRCFY